MPSPGTTTPPPSVGTVPREATQDSGIAHLLLLPFMVTTHVKVKSVAQILYLALRAIFSDPPKV